MTSHTGPQRIKRLCHLAQHFTPTLHTPPSNPNSFTFSHLVLCPWCAHDVIMVYPYCAYGVPLLSPWCTLLCPWCAPTVPLLCPHCAPAVPLLCPWHGLLCPWCAPAVPTEIKGQPVGVGFLLARKCPYPCPIKHQAWQQMLLAPEPSC